MNSNTKIIKNMTETFYRVVKVLARQKEREEGKEQVQNHTYRANILCFVDMMVCMTLKKISKTSFKLLNESTSVLE